MVFPGKTMILETQPFTNRDLAERLRFETLLTDLCSRFVGIPTDCIGSEIENAQRAMFVSGLREIVG
jgi:hypothetical protein